MMHDLFQWIIREEYWGLLWGMFLGVFIVPIPVEGLLVFSGFLIYKGELRLLPAFFASLLGSFGATLIWFLIGRSFGVYVVEKFGHFFGITNERIAAIHAWFNSKGRLGLVLGYYLPGVRHLIGLMSGASKMDFPRFVLFSSLGAAFWCYPLIVGGFFIGEEWHEASHILGRNVALGFAILVMLAAFFYLKKDSRIVKEVEAAGHRIWRLLAKIAGILAALVAAYIFTFYLFFPIVLRHYEHNVALEEAPKVTLTKNGIPGDALNIALIGTQEELIRAFASAGWHPADPITLESSVGIALSVALNKSYAQAPVSPLYLFGRREDLAFEKSAATSPSERHHVRFWNSGVAEKYRKPLWLGAATFDKSVGLSHRTGQVTHHIAPNIDAERDGIVNDFIAAGQLEKIYQVTGTGQTLEGRNGEGDWYYTDGELTVGVISDKNQPVKERPKMFENPPVIDLKNQAWSLLKEYL